MNTRVRSIVKRARPTTVIYVDPGTGKFINANAILRKEARTDGWRVEKEGGEKERERRGEEWGSKAIWNALRKY